MSVIDNLPINRAGNRLAEILTRKSHRREGQSWLIVYLDVITLLLAMFILLVNEPQDLQSPQQAKVASSAVTQKTPMPSEIIQESTADAPASLDIEPPPEVQTGLANAETATQPELEITLVEEIEESPSEPEQTADVVETIEEPLPGELPASVEVSDEQGPSQVMIDQLKALDAEQMRIEISAGQVNLHLPEAILFATGQSQLLQDANALLDTIAPILQQNSFPVSVEGHTDNVPISSSQFPSNWELSSARAAVVIRKLVEAGIDFKRLKAIGYADTQPIADNDSETGRSQNRRVNIIIHAQTE